MLFSRHLSFILIHCKVKEYCIPYTGLCQTLGQSFQSVFFIYRQCYISMLFITKILFRGQMGMNEYFMLLINCSYFFFCVLWYIVVEDIYMLGWTVGSSKQLNSQQFLYKQLLCIRNLGQGFLFPQVYVLLCAETKYIYIYINYQNL